MNTAQGVTLLYDALKAKANGATRLPSRGESPPGGGRALLDKAAARGPTEAAAPAPAAGGFTIRGEGDPGVDALVLRRAGAKKAKDFAEADRIRDELKARGIEVTDVPGGAVWKRV